MESTIAPRRRFQFTLRELLLSVGLTFVGMLALNPLLFPRHPGPGSVVIILMTVIGAGLAFSERTPTERTRLILLFTYIIAAWVLLFLLCFFQRRNSLLVLMVLLLPIFLGVFVSSVRAHSEALDQRRAAIPIALAFGVSIVMYLLVTCVIPDLVWPPLRMGTSDSAAAAACKAFVEAEEIYHRVDYTGNGTLKYAKRLRDLYEASGAPNVCLVDRTFADAEIARGTEVPKAGYVYKVLKHQGPNATGGRRSYLDENGNMTRGYALVARPEPYDYVSRVTYIISGNGTIFEADLGPDTASIVDNMIEFDPDPATWVPTQ